MKNQYENRSPIKPRSLSMPTLSPIVIPHPIIKTKKTKQHDFEIPNEGKNMLPTISLLGMKNKAEEEFSSKIKLIAQRNMKKIEERYNTVDRWKHKYLPNSSILIIKLKEKEEELIQDHLRNLESQGKADTSPEQEVKQKKQKLKPIVTKHPMIQTIPDYQQQSKKLEEELLTRLQKNKRYYKTKNEVEKEINYFKLEQNPRSSQKRRQMELKKAIANSDNNKFAGMFHKKMVLSEHYPDLKIIKDVIKKREEHPHNLFLKNPEEEGEEITFSKLIKRSRSIHQLKENLLEEATKAVPEGWNNNFPHQSEDDIQQ